MVNSSDWTNLSVNNNNNNIGECKICGSKNYSLLLENVSKVVMKSDEDYSILNCMDCSHYFTSPIPTDEQLKKAYKNFGPHKIRPSNKRSSRLQFIKNHKLLGFFYIITYKILGARFSYFFKPNNRYLLDVGCGSGQFLIDMQELGWKVSGQDLYEGAGIFAKDKKINVDICDIKTLSEKSSHCASFDIITGWHVLEHTNDPKDFIKSIKNMLKPGGTIIIEVPNANALERYMFGGKWWCWMTPVHLQHFNKKSIRKLIADCGFSEIKLQTKKTHLIQSLKMKPNFLIRILAAISWLIQKLTNTGSVLYITAKNPKQ